MSECTPFESATGHRMYTSVQGEQLRDVIVQCDESTCDGKPCRGYHKAPHRYFDEECFCSCNHAGHKGACIPVFKGAA